MCHRSTFFVPLHKFCSIWNIFYSCFHAKKKKNNNNNNKKASFRTFKRCLRSKKLEPLFKMMRVILVLCRRFSMRGFPNVFDTYLTFYWRYAWIKKMFSCCEEGWSDFWWIPFKKRLYDTDTCRVVYMFWQMLDDNNKVMSNYQQCLFAMISNLMKLQGSVTKMGGKLQTIIKNCLSYSFFLRGKKSIHLKYFFWVVLMNSPTKS